MSRPERSTGLSVAALAFMVGWTAGPRAAVAGAEEAPPANWTVSNISDGGTWDAVQEEIKWGPFFDPSIPEVLTYDITPPGETPGEYCFSGIVVFDTLNQPIGGDECVGFGIPAISTWGSVVTTLLALTIGTLLCRRHVSAGR